MKEKLQKLQMLESLANRVHEKSARMALMPLVALMCNPSWAALPTLPTPSGGAIGGGQIGQDDWLANMGGWFKSGITILGLVLASIGFVYVVMGGLQKWRKYSAGQAEIGDLKEYFIMGAVFAVFLVAMVTYAFSTLA